MFRCHNLKINADEYDLEEDQEEIEFCSKQTRNIRNCLNKFYFNSSNFDKFIIDGTKLQNFCFPSEEKHIFISHSHNDTKIARALSFVFSKISLKLFIDSDVWMYANDLLQKIDDEYCYNYSRETYSYQKRNFTTSHVHMMLASALNSMIDKCECLIFINTENSIEEYKNKPATFSPWIMSELYTSAIIRRRENSNRLKAVMEGFVYDHTIKTASETGVSQNAPEFII
jgi:hypothetical protein